MKLWSNLSQILKSLLEVIIICNYCKLLSRLARLALAISKWLVPINDVFEIWQLLSKCNTRSVKSVVVVGGKALTLSAKTFAKSNKGKSVCLHLLIHIPLLTVPLVIKALCWSILAAKVVCNWWSLNQETDELHEETQWYNGRKKVIGEPEVHF